MLTTISELTYSGKEVICIIAWDSSLGLLWVKCGIWVLFDIAELVIM